MQPRKKANEQNRTDLADYGNFAVGNDAGLGSAGSDPQTSSELAENLHLAEQDRDAAFAERDRAISEMRNRLDQTEAELRAAMDGLGNARREAEELRSEVERLRVKPG